MAESTVLCRYCRSRINPGDCISCPSCGAPIDVRERVSSSGWEELPPIPDMTRLQLGRSTCQIEGRYVPISDFNLAEGDGVYFAHHVLLWKDPTVRIGAMSLRGAFKRILAGMPVVMTEAWGPGHVAFSRDEPGELVAVPLQPGAAVDVREHLFLAATHQVTYDWFPTGIWYVTGRGDESETHYPLGTFMDRFSAGSGSAGLLLLHAGGNVFLRDLQRGESLLIKPTALLYKDVTVAMRLHLEYPGGTWRAWRPWGERYVWLRLIGPGRVATHSAYGRFEDPPEPIRRSSGATEQRWW